MKRLLLPLLLISFINIGRTQPAGLLNEVFNLKYLQVGDIYYTPNGENPNVAFYELPGSHVINADGIFNTLNAGANFDGTTITLHSYSITQHDCVEPNCYYENLYFYEVLKADNMQSKTLTYTYNHSNGFKYLTLVDADYNKAYFSTAPNEDPSPLLFQNWYLYKSDVDLGEPTFYTGPNPPQITINSDLSYTGVEDCSLIDGNLIFSEGDLGEEFILQSRNYNKDESNCTDGSPSYVLGELEWGLPLRSLVYQGNDGIDYFQYEYFPGFTYYFRNVLILSTPEHQINTLTIFPNPVEDKLCIKSNMVELDLISIMDINGRTVIFEEDENLKVVDVSGLKAGMYFIRVESASGNTVKKFIKN
ncbi:T9SS type A sorting domain-containing protein [Aequorivita ciconiae]|nr:T9SS type A sorting domain-containing protein [Aequorivita sp. H23M31]